MTEPTISYRVQRTVAEVFDLSVEGVTPESSAQSIAAWDSVRHLNLVLALEQEFHVQFSPEDIERMVDVQAIVKALEDRGLK